MSLGNDLQTYQSLFIVNIAAVALSLLGCISMIGYCLLITRKTAALKLILCLSCSDLMYSIANLLSIFSNYETNTAFCQVEGFIRQYSLIFSIYLATCTSILCFKDAKYGLYFNKDRFLTKVVLIGMTFCLALAVTPFAIPQIGYVANRLDCWVAYLPNNSYAMPRIILLMIYQGIPLCIGFGVSLIVYYKAIMKYKELAESLIGYKIHVYRLLWYPAVLFLIFVPSLIDHIVQIYYPGSLVTETLHVFFTHSMGFANALVYGLQRSRWANAIETGPIAKQNELSGSTLTASITRELQQANISYH